MEPSDEELGAFNLSECQRLRVPSMEVGRVLNRIPVSANRGWRWVDMVG